LASEILEKYGTDIKQLTFIPSGGGVFEIALESKLIFSKKLLDRFPEDGEIIKLLESK
tara:strand:- start:997 stop:1170 length:174 start_codon:yes stop_codon:yes gene_type:complete